MRVTASESISRLASTPCDDDMMVMILSDGYDSNNANDLVEALKSLRKRGCKIIWLNPLKGWKDYAPVTASMAASLPYLDLFCPANTLKDLADLEGALAKL